MAEEKVLKIPSNKHEGKFKDNVAWLAKLLGSEKNLLPSNKVAKDDLPDLISSLFEDDRKKKIEMLRADLKTTLEKYADYQKLKKEKIAEFAKLDEQKMEEFNKAIDGIKRRIEDAKEHQEFIQEGANKITGGEETSTSPSQEA